MESNMGLSRYRYLFVICILACVLCGVYIKLLLTNEKLAVHHIVHSMFANQVLSQDNKHSTVIFENVMKTNVINIHKCLPITQTIRKKEAMLPTLCTAEDKILKNLRNNCSYHDALQGKNVFVALKANSDKVTPDNYKKKTANKFIHEFSKPFKRDPNHS